MLQIYRETGDFKSLDEGYDYLFRLEGSSLPPSDTRRVEAGLEYLGWQREVHCRGFDNSNARLLKLYQLNQRMLKSLGDSVGRNPDWHGELVMSQLRNLYLVLGQDLEQWLDSPAELPGGDFFCGNEHGGGWADGGADTVVVTAHYTISERGQVRELEVSVGDDSHRSQGKRIARMLRQTHFRPRYITGQPESVEQISREYVLRD